MEFLSSLPNWIMTALLGYNIIVIKKLIEKMIESSKHAHERINLHDRAISEMHSKPFDTSAIAKGFQLFPVLTRPRRDS